MNMFKKNGGFTLVELIVVIAILAILAAVAVPAYNGYITKAQDAAVVTDLDAIKTAAMGANATAGSVSQVTVGTDGKTITITATTYAEKISTDFVLFYADATAKADAQNGSKVFERTAVINNWESSSYADGATWTPADGWQAN